jgi:hypothetical protein
MTTSPRSAMPPMAHHVAVLAPSGWPPAPFPGAGSEP